MVSLDEIVNDVFVSQSGFAVRPTSQFVTSPQLRTSVLQLGAYRMVTSGHIRRGRYQQMLSEHCKTIQLDDRALPVFRGLPVTILSAPVVLLQIK